MFGRLSNKIPHDVNHIALVPFCAFVSSVELYQIRVQLIYTFVHSQRKLSTMILVLVFNWVNFRFGTIRTFGNMVRKFVWFWIWKSNYYYVCSMLVYGKQTNINFNLYYYEYKYYYGIICVRACECFHSYSFNFKVKFCYDNKVNHIHGTKERAKRMCSCEIEDCAFEFQQLLLYTSIFNISSNLLKNSICSLYLAVQPTEPILALIKIQTIRRTNFHKDFVQ